jgi:hypothetical protein
VTLSEIDATLDRYATGLDAKIGLLRQVQSHAAQAERDLAAGAPVTDLVSAIDARNRLIDTLLELESQLVPVRDQLRAHKALAESRPGSSATFTLHDVADSLIQDIVASDERTVRALREAADARRQAANLLDAGGQTLAAYRRILAPPPANANLFDQIG